LQNIEDKQADQPAKINAAPFRVHVLPLLNRRGWMQLDLQKYIYVQDVLCNVMERIVELKCFVE